MNSKPFPKPGAEGERLLSAASYLMWLVGFPVVGPAVVFYLKRDEAPAVARHAAQAVVLGVFSLVLQAATLFAGYAVMFGAAHVLRDRYGRGSDPMVVLIPLLGWGLVFVEGMLFAVVSAYGAAKAYRGESWRIPVASAVAGMLFRTKAVGASVPDASGAA